MIGFVFPGQGSQSVAMLRDIANVFPEVESTFDAASQALGYDLWQLVQQGPTVELDKTVHTQPALLAAGYAVWRIIQSQHPQKPALFAGHSLGEYTALVCAEAISFTDAIKLVAARGRYMQEAVPAGEGALAAIVGLDNDAVDMLCKKAALGEEVLAPANFNSPEQVVISGHKLAMQRALILAKEAGARLAMLLPVSVPAHSVLMKPAAERLADYLTSVPIQSPVIPVVNNVDVAIYQDADSIRDGLIRQLYKPVRWVETVQAFVKAGITRVVECGPGKVLSGLNKRIASELQLAHTSDLASLQLLLEMK